MPIKDIMTSRVIAVSPETYINDVIHIIEKDKISGIPVVDEGNKLVGIISEIMDHVNNPDTKPS